MGEYDPARMASALVPQVPKFNVVDIDPAAVAKALQDYVVRGSKLVGVSLDEINLGTYDDPGETSAWTLTDCLKHGIKLFDAMVWLTAGRPVTHQPKKDTKVKANDVATPAQVAEAVFYVYFFLLTQARYPVDKNGTADTKVPQFLDSIMNLKEGPGVYVKQICNFNVNKFDPRWIRHVTFDDMGQEVISRFGLGVAGYRLFGPFKVVPITKSLTEAQRKAVEFATTVAKSAPSWNIHPVTRHPEVLTARGNLNKNLANLILEVYTTEEIKKMTEIKMLYDTPKSDPQHQQYKTWSAVDDITGSAKIFPDRK